ncbi:18737_t:CDS:2 [Funneliformis geosporum]|uniref:18737_t:CDS:1 n=1 Tax=Funneliformis geosporum TaxID=1117311 RepID=A0A9W4SP79_9GLOM|nr:18737_t:CDS:2 [Funneliformis geosporum]
MGINSSDIHLIIHCMGPLNMMNLVQQIGREEHDGSESRSVIFYSIKKDLRTNFVILAKNREIHYYLWNGDSVHSPCLKCDNCKNQIKELLTCENCIGDILYLLDIVEEMGNSNCEITEDDVVEIFCKSNTKKIRESVRSYVEQKISLYYSSPNAQNLSASMFIVRLIAEAKMRVMEDSWYYWDKLSQIIPIN